MDGSRLAGSPSLYLRQHADDPVDWYPWGDDAFAAARDSGRPVLLSCGYSACHWCHVMQRESFRDPETADLLNAGFVAVKVDREQRPDVDALYMDYVTASTGSGGWPMTVFLTPDRVPVFGGTYFPKEPVGLTPSLREVLDALLAAWGDTERLGATVEGSLAMLREQAAPRQAADVDRDVVDTAADYIVRLVDQVEGGFGAGAKFPQAALVRFLTEYGRTTGDPEVVYVVERTLTALLRGGVHDHAGGGIHRYAVDRQWRTPHFEKMLYDNALLLSTLSAALPIASSDAVREEYAAAARGTAAFLRRDMALPGGGFAASLSADTGGVEGATYLWTRDELAGFLDSDQLRVATEQLGAEPGAGPSTLTRRAGRGEDAEAVDAVLARIAEARAERPQPERDDKAVTSWNALAARGLLDAGAAFGDPAMTALGIETLSATLERAVRGADVVHDPGDPAMADVRLIEDPALLAAACLTAHEATSAPAWLETARELHASVLERFTEGPELYMTAANTDLPVRPREKGDEPTPSGASTTVENAVRLAELTGDDAYAESAAAILRTMWAALDMAPEFAGTALGAALRLLGD